MTELLTMKKRMFLLFLSAMMLCMANVPLYTAAVIPDGVIIEENPGVVDELMPMAASGCLGAYPDYPDNDGFLDGYSVVTLPAGTELCQYRRSNATEPSRFYCMPGTSAESLALPPIVNGITYSCVTIILTKPTTFHVGTVAPWGNCYNGWNSGGGTQYVLPNS